MVCVCRRCACVRAREEERGRPVALSTGERGEERETERGEEREAERGEARETCSVVDVRESLGGTPEDKSATRPPSDTMPIPANHIISDVCHPDVSYHSSKVCHTTRLQHVHHLISQLASRGRPKALAPAPT